MEPMEWRRIFLAARIKALKSTPDELKTNICAIEMLIRLQARDAEVAELERIWRLS